ncbi:hypothetical protein SNEBB_002406 [Seison nebaliae]|nr:hypothetical protein SNEBB_002406 [Seison nebaliae]
MNCLSDFGSCCANFFKSSPSGKSVKRTLSIPSITVSTPKVNTNLRSVLKEKTATNSRSSEPSLVSLHQKSHANIFKALYTTEASQIEQQGILKESPTIRGTDLSPETLEKEREEFEKILKTDTVPVVRTFKKDEVVKEKSLTNNGFIMEDEAIVDNNHFMYAVSSTELNRNRFSHRRSFLDKSLKFMEKVEEEQLHEMDNTNMIFVKLKSTTQVNQMPLNTTNVYYLATNITKHHFLSSFTLNHSDVEFTTEGRHVHFSYPLENVGLNNTINSSFNHISNVSNFLSMREKVTILNSIMENEENKKILLSHGVVCGRVIYKSFHESSSGCQDPDMEYPSDSNLREMQFIRKGAHPQRKILLIRPSLCLYGICDLKLKSIYHLIKVNKSKSCPEIVIYKSKKDGKKQPMSFPKIVLPENETDESFERNDPRKLIKTIFDDRKTNKRLFAKHKTLRAISALASPKHKKLQKKMENINIECNQDNGIIILPFKTSSMTNLRRFDDFEKRTPKVEVKHKESFLNQLGKRKKRFMKPKKKKNHDAGDKMTIATMSALQSILSDPESQDRIRLLKGIFDIERFAVNNAKTRNELTKFMGGRLSRSMSYLDDIQVDILQSDQVKEQTINFQNHKKPFNWNSTEDASDKKSFRYYADVDEIQELDDNFFVRNIPSI